MGPHALATLVSALLLASLPARAYYRCTDETGVVFRDRPCERAIRAEQISPGGRVLSYETVGNSPPRHLLDVQSSPSTSRTPTDSLRGRQSVTQKPGRF